jgi:hypothetical protein
VRLAAGVFVLFGVASAHAGVLCGTVRDRDTAAPIERAGVFIRTTAGVYTGLYAGTDAQGRFCIDPIPPGTYDVEVRVDDYRIGYRRNVVVTAATSDVGLDARPPLARLDVWPRPARDQVSFGIRLVRAVPVRLEVFDARGRQVKAWSAQSLAGERIVRWDFRDHGGRRLPSANYVVRLRAGDQVVVRRVSRVQ